MKIEMLLIVFLLLIVNINSQYEPLATAQEYQDFICSFNGKPIVKSPMNVDCLCYSNYATLNPDNIKIYGIPIKCDYKMKNSHILIFLAIVQPFGFELLYIGHIFLFLMNFLFAIISISALSFSYIKSQQSEFLNSKTTIFLLIMVGIVFITYIAKIIILLIIDVKDYNGISLVDDTYYLFSFY